MVPTTSSAGQLTGVKRGGTPISFSTQTIKGVEYAFLDATPGSYEATYAVDDAAPLITGVSATPKSDGTATITWTTNEPSDSRVDYGTAPGSLTSSKTESGLVTSHSIELTGLTPNTTYHYRVTSADGAANAAASPPTSSAPASFTTPSASFVDTTTADFGAGSPGAGAYLGEAGDGELLLNPEVGSEFSGSSLPGGWSPPHVWGGGRNAPRCRAGS